MIIHKYSEIHDFTATCLYFTSPSEAHNLSLRIMIDRLSLNNSYTFGGDGGSKKVKTPLKGEFAVDKGAVWL